MEAECEQVHGADEEEEEEEEAGAGESMLWSLQEALERQTLQIGASACGATAVVDVLKALGVDVAPEEADRCVQTRLRRNDSPLPDYLLSRSVAGATHAQLIAGAEEASKGAVMGRFFHLHPRRQVKLVPWLARWIQKGAVPVATMNMQLAVPEGEEVPDAWHHQLIFGVAPDTVFMTNPLDVVSEGEVHQRLCSASVLLIRRADVLQRLTPDSCLSSLSESQSDPRWKALDVEGQVRQMAREEEQEQERSQLTHITIPAAYSSGITLFALQESGLGQELLNAPELPLL
ncbi:uncharacterized protein LOC120797912 [Xiphias gladius]|uniref:uncharacterized protein LOC120797912 n=1 Tax=Xiphias gladius TaxID=8245 RepID=UPI001A983B23|nr:uncharacterized protein LOC120797912 [Xiphias gladius]XP_039997624.1 uncharacterized protein LOC120797912 [Xiphias gladius]XP_039997625.1 uncharacterized protein LOC120797912 [Xiphias gladius]XP_039997626.1 uncharacterized protein LOC120797912 [Xiphias gladius]XP_039997627.1 uncharacterized protein LOC120797912 [Xiphias gladius]XP_039997628.1 uncharacterized protein LOC120797912 [Xiphias gladius]XP_039997629.1 uncharacterized protein LOC120797912 [Xiphias gladius]